jgi:hypothetical protein
LGKTVKLGNAILQADWTKEIEGIIGKALFARKVKCEFRRTASAALGAC